MIWWRKTWDLFYSLSSIMLAFLLGVVLGNVLQGIAIGENFEYQGKGLFEFFTPFTLLTGFSVLFLLMTHGAIYLLLKTEGKLYVRLTFLVKKGIIAFVVIFAITTLYTLIYIPHLSDKFKNNPEFFVVPLAAFFSIANIPRLVSKKKFMPAFLFSSLTICLLLVLVAVELYPNMLLSTVDPKYNIDIYNAASSQKSLKIMLSMVVIGGPLVLAYTIFVYRTFKGKVKLDEHSY